MKIAVITIVYNDVAHIEQTLLSVIGQSAYDHIEYIVVDGASTDGTSHVIQKYREKLSKYICEPDSGIYNAMNKGLMMVSGGVDYVMFINSGDRLASADVIEQMIQAVENELPDVAYGNYCETSDGVAPSKVIPCRNRDKIWYGMVASHQSNLYRMQHLRNHHIRYDESYKIAADYKLTAQAIKMAKSVLRTDICVSEFDVSGVSSSNQDLGLKEANRVRREVFGWGPLRIGLLTIVLLCARYAKKYLNPIYSYIRY